VLDFVQKHVFLPRQFILVVLQGALDGKILDADRMFSCPFS
jgi:hypothetical protein